MGELLPLIRRNGEIVKFDRSFATRKNLMWLEEKLRAALNDPDHDYGKDFPLVHKFYPGLYERQITLPTDSLVVGKIHRHAHVNFISRGHVSVMTEFGVTEFRAPVTFVSEPGVKRAVYAHEETTWTTYHQANSTDLMEIEKEVICKTFEEFDQYQAGLKLLEDLS
jgi:hypothetical protein